MQTIELKIYGIILYKWARDWLLRCWMIYEIKCAKKIVNILSHSWQLFSIPWFIKKQEEKEDKLYNMADKKREFWSCNFYSILYIEIHFFSLNGKWYRRDWAKATCEKKCGMNVYMYCIIMISYKCYIASQSTRKNTHTETYIYRWVAASLASLAPRTASIIWSCTFVLSAYFSFSLEKLRLIF